MSTPAYRVVLALHGWEQLSTQLGRLAVSGRWAEMPDLITDDVLDVMAVRGTWAELPAQIYHKYGDRISYYLPFIPGENDPAWQSTIKGFQQLTIHN